MFIGLFFYVLGTCMYSLTLFLKCLLLFSLFVTLNDGCTCKIAIIAQHLNTHLNTPKHTLITLLFCY